jgi:hypothetical protein
MAGVAERQFAVLAELAAALGAAGIPFWLRGGWALDFLLGRITRPHADIDLVARLSDRDGIFDALTSEGFRHARELPGAAIDFERDGESVQIVLFERSPSGTLVTRGFESWPWPDGALDGPVREIDGVVCRTLAPSALLEEKATYRKHRGRELREKDHLSIRLLRQVLADYESQEAAASASSPAERQTPPRSRTSSSRRK